MGKGGEKSTESAPAAVKKEVLIEGRLYDVSNMKHPGGTVIDFYAGKGIDASQAFANFHIRSKKAKKILDHLPSRAVEEKTLKANLLPGQADLLADFDQLTRDLEKEGFFKASVPHTIYRIVEVILFHVVGVYLVLNNNIALGLISLAIGQGRCGWLMHEGGHYSISGNNR